jgi:hypothetical protein
MRKLSAKQMARRIRLFAAGKSYRQIAAAVGVTVQAISLSLRRAGIADPTIKREDRHLFRTAGLCVVCGEPASWGLRCGLHSNWRLKNRRAELAWVPFEIPKAPRPPKTEPALFQKRAVSRASRLRFQAMMAESRRRAAVASKAEAERRRAGS